jgi:hypothetical protein
MKTRGKALALLALSMFLAWGCATVSPPAGEHEEELTTEEKAALEEQKIQERIEMRGYFGDGDSE